MKELSICIPTFNRYPFLKWTLEKTIKDFPESKIIVSNNASTDDTRTCRIRYFLTNSWIQQETNIGAFPNMYAALMASDTTYCMYLGDDDYLLPDEIQKGIDFLDNNWEIDYYCAPCQLWNEVEQEAVFEAFFVCEDKTYVPDKPADLWNFVINNHVWPEHIIYRRSALEKILTPRNIRAYWAFTDLGRALLNGPIHFASKPFYRNIVHHPVGNRAKLGDRQCLTYFDEYRGGLEHMAFDLFQGYLTPELKTQIQMMITRFIGQRLELAETLLRRQNINSEANSYAKRKAMSMLGRHD